MVHAGTDPKLIGVQPTTTNIVLGMVPRHSALLRMTVVAVCCAVMTTLVVGLAPRQNVVMLPAMT